MCPSFIKIGTTVDRMSFGTSNGCFPKPDSLDKCSYGVNCQFLPSFNHLSVLYSKIDRDKRETKA